MFVGNLCYNTLSTSEQNDVISLDTVLIVNFEHVTLSSSVTAVNFQYLSIFWV